MDEPTKMKPRDYGAARGIAPQLVYYHIREGHIVVEQCSGGCGCTVIDTDQADKYFKKGVHSE